ncbi:MAG: DUF3597 domain-containing protein [Chloroflexi bacterium]|nr:DUF3597 domain-containing protein [Chloroflexota bacterium]
MPKTPPPSPQAGAAPRPAPQVSQAAPPPREFEHGSGIPRPVPATPATPAEIPMVDVVSKLDRLAAENPQKLNWKVSIVDMLKLLDIDSSYEARKELAVELGCPTDKMGDSAQMNTWLHKTVMQKLAENGGNIPKELLD